jgi:predicted metal-dependent hydrolase
MQEATMSQPYFDTLKYVKLLSDHHFSNTQVQGLMSAEIHVLQSTLARMVTQEDLRRSEYALRADLVETEHKLRAEISEVKHQLEAKISTTASDLKTFVVKNTLWTILAMISLNIGSVALILEVLTKP